jgi:hypothetical protein
VFVDIEVENPPNALRRSNVTTIDVLLNFVTIIFESSTVRAFVNIFKAIFDSTKRCNGLNICMAMKLG